MTMNLIEAISLMKKYAECPKCGCAVVGNDKGTFECDTQAGYFKRTCSCGWHVEINESGDMNDS